MKPTGNLRCYVDDNLVSRWYDPETHKTYSQGKRVPASCPLNELERMVYVRKGLVELLKIMRSNRPTLSLAELLSMAKEARGRNRAAHRFISKSQRDLERRYK